MSSGLFENLLQEIASILDIFDKPAASSTDTKRSLVQAVGILSRCSWYYNTLNYHVPQVNKFRDDLNHGKDAANTLQGGELSIGDQDDIIETLERLRDQKKYVSPCSDLPAV